MLVIVGGSVLAGLGCNGRLLMPLISETLNAWFITLIGLGLVWAVGRWIHATLSLISKGEALNIYSTVLR